MREVLYQLAYRNIKKYKKHYMFIAIVVLMMSALYMSIIIGYSNYYEVKKSYHQDTYGTWYFYTETNDENQKYFVDEANAMKANYGFWNDQGFSDDGLSIGNLSKELYKLCHLDLVEGRYPENDHEIMVSSHIAKLHPLHTSLSLSIMDGETQDYKIVGVIENSQDIFPNIYTDIKKGITTRIVSDTLLGIHDIEYNRYELRVEEHDNFTSYQFEPIFNEFGYDENESMGYVHQMNDQLLLFTEVTLCIVTILIAITSISLNRRAKEFALLRGIGMTSKQLFIMIVYENAITILLSLFSGIIISFGIVYICMLYLETIYHYFIYHIDIPTILLYFSILFACIMLSTMCPIFSSAKYSLSGTFDSTNFKYIQVRYRKLKKQTCFSIAKREMTVYKKTSVFLMCLFGFLSILFIFDFMIPISKEIVKEIQEFQSFHYIHFQFDIDNQEEVKKMKDTSIYQIKNLDDSFRVKYLEYNDLKGIYRVMSLDNRDDFEKCEIEGRLPKNKNEILINGYVQLCEEVINGNETVLSVIENLNINDVISMNGKDYIVVGKILPNEEVHVKELMNSSTVFGLYYVPTSAEIIVLPELFSELNGELELLGYRYYKDSSQEEGIMDELNQNSHFYDLFTSDSIFYDNVVSLNQYNFINDQLNPSLLILPVIVSIIFSYFLNKNDMINHKKDYALFYLIGMTKKDMFKKQLYKAVFMTYLIFVMIVIWILLIDLNLGILKIPVVEVFLMVSTIFIISLIIYCLPLYRLWKEDVLLPFYDNQ